MGILLLEDKESIRKITLKLKSKNPDFSINEIEGMVCTSIWQQENATKKSIYFDVLKRILEEKGYKYKEGKLFNPIQSVENIESIVFKKTQKICVTYLAKEIIRQLKLNDIEKTVLSLEYGIDDIEIIGTKGEEAINKIGHKYFMRKLTKKEIAFALGKTTEQLFLIRKSIKQKIKKFHENF